MCYILAMEIVWLGQACFKIKGKNLAVVIDPFDPDFIGLKLPKDLAAQIVLSTHEHRDHNNVGVIGGNPLIIKGPGEYEKLGVNITGVAAFHDTQKGAERGPNTIYHLLMDEVNLVHLGDLGHLLTEEEIATIETADILMVPVGGGPTIDAEKATKVLAQLEPRIVIPMHYKVSGLKFELADVDLFLKEMGAEDVTPIPKLSITRDKLPEETTVVVLSKSG